MHKFILPLLGLVLTSASVSAFAAETAQLSCTGLVRKGFAMTVTIEDGKASANVLSVDQSDPSELPLGLVELGKRTPLLHGWVAYEGLSSKGQPMYFKADVRNFESREAFQAELVISSSTTTPIESGLDLICQSL